MSPSSARRIARPTGAASRAATDRQADGSPRAPVTETIEHLVVRTHRHTGRKGLFFSTAALGLTGLTETESQGTAAVPAASRVVAQPCRGLRVETGRFRDLGQPGHVALRRERLRRPSCLSQGHRRLNTRWRIRSVSLLVSPRLPRPVSRQDTAPQVVERFRRAALEP